MNKKFITICLLFLSSFIGYSLSSEEIQISKKALKYLELKDYQSYYNLKYQLQNTSIYSYLQYKEISIDPGIFKQFTIDKYFKQQNNIYWQYRLFDDLAQYYARKEDWKLFKKYYKSTLGVSGKCWNIQAEYELGDKIKALKEYIDLWQHFVFMPNSCSAIHKYWDESDYKPKLYLINKAYTLAFANKFNDSLSLLNIYVKNNDDYLHYITKFKDSIENPSKLDEFIITFHNYKHFDKIFLNISKNILSKDLIKYVKIWNNLKNKRYLSKKNQQKCISLIALSFARAHSPEAKQWLEKIDNKYLNYISWEWLLRVDLYNNDFANYIKNYYNLPKELQQYDSWKYWLAYSYDKEGELLKAKKIYEKLIKKPLNYYSFLASDKIGKPYNFVNSKYNQVINTKELLSQDYATNQAIDLYQMGKYKDSTMLWNWNIRNKLRINNITEIENLAYLAEANHMYYAAIFNMSVIGNYNNIVMLFPKAFICLVNKNVKKFGIDRNIILSIMRQESLFNIESISLVGAKGLMQITEPTAKFISKKYKISLNEYKDIEVNRISPIFIPHNNIKLGAANLYFLDNLFSKNIILGITAYNAGPGNVAKWLNEKEVPAAIWIENIPFSETRNYIKKVLTYIIIYNNFIFQGKNNNISKLLDYDLSVKQSFIK